MSKSEFDRLEQFVSKLLSKYDALREEHSRLEKLLVQRDEEITSLKADISSADSERGDMTSRVKGLIEQIEDWETAIGESADESEIEAAPEEVQEEDMEEEVVEADEVDEESQDMEPREDKDGGTQQNLFNVEPRTGSFSS